MSFVSSGKLGNIQTNREQLLREEILDRYQHIGGKKDASGNWLTEGQNWLKGLDGHVRDNVALLYENQAKYFRANMNESTESGSSGGFEAQAFPMIRRIYSRLLANDIVSVQAMTQPTGALFFYYPNISERILSSSGGTHAPNIGKKPDCLLLGHNCPDVTYSGCKSLYDRFYNDDLYDHSKGSFTIISASGTPVKLDVDSCWIPATGVTLAQDGSIRQVKYRVDGFAGRGGANLNNFTARTYRGNGLEVDTEEFLASFTVLYDGNTPIVDKDNKVIYKKGDVMNYRLPAQAYGKGLVDITDICDENGNLYVEVDLTHPLDCATCDSFDGYIGAASGTSTLTGSTNIVFAWRRYDSLENETEIGEVSFEIRKVTISVESRKLRARWTPELATDIQAYHNIDAEAELTALLSEQIAMEIDRQILRELKRGAAWKLRWNYFGWKSTGSQKYTQKEWNQTLITRINQVSAQIHKSTLRGGANFLVVSSETSAIFDDLDAFIPSSHDLEDYTYNLGMKQVGTVSGRYKVYVDPYAKPGEILIGHKGTSLLDTGYIYAPYLPLQLTPTITDPDTLTMVKGIATRYATKMVNNKYFGVIVVDNQITFDPLELR